MNSLNGTPTLGDYVISTAVDGLSSLNSSTDLTQGDGVITRLVEWAGKQGKQSSWMHDLFDVMEHEPYVGDSLDLALSLEGQDLFRVKTVLHNGALYIGLDHVAQGVSVINVQETGSFGLPDTVARISMQDHIVNISALGAWLDLTIVGQLPDGRRTTWNISINPDSGEVLPGGLSKGLQDTQILAKAMTG